MPQNIEKFSSIWVKPSTGADQSAGIGDAEAAGGAPPFALERPLHQVAVVVGDREAPGQGAAQVAERARRTEHAVLRMDLLLRERPVEHAEQLAADVREGALAARHLEIGERRPDRLRREARVGQVEGGELEVLPLRTTSRAAGLFSTSAWPNTPTPLKSFIARPSQKLR